jgi:hypothetical protein
MTANEQNYHLSFKKNNNKTTTTTKQQQNTRTKNKKTKIIQNKIINE